MSTVTTLPRETPTKSAEEKPSAVTTVQGSAEKPRAQSRTKASRENLIPDERVVFNDSPRDLSTPDMNCGINAVPPAFAINAQANVQMQTTNPASPPSQPPPMQKKAVMHIIAPAQKYINVVAPEQLPDSGSDSSFLDSSAAASSCKDHPRPGTGNGTGGARFLRHRHVVDGPQRRLCTPGVGAARRCPERNCRSKVRDRTAK